MGERFDPGAWLGKIFPKGIEKYGLLDDGLDIKKRYLKALVRATSLSGRKISAEVYKTVEFYAAKESALKAAGEKAFKAEALNGQSLLTQRLKNFLVYSEVQEQRKHHKGRMYRWLPSAAAEPDPEHQLLYGKIFREGEGDKDGNMPGERWGCQCGIEWLDDEEAFKEFAGREFSGYKGQKAVKKLMKERNGYIKNAFKTRYKDNISLVWGNGRIGFDHLIIGRSKQYPIDDFLKDFSTIVKRGEKFPNKYSDTRFDLWDRKRKKLIVIETVFGAEKKINFPVTIVRQNNRPKR